jgi:cell division protein FtsW (lipid II flippase)
MTLPFVSYGGSSVLAIALGMGMLLALTRKRIGERAASTGLPHGALAAGSAR